MFVLKAEEIIKKIASSTKWNISTTTINNTSDKSGTWNEQQKTFSRKHFYGGRGK